MRSHAFSVIIVLGLIFIGFGDAFLPEPLAQASYQTRNQINEFLTGLLNLPSDEEADPTNQDERWEPWKEDGSSDNK